MSAMRSAPGKETIPPEAFLAGYPEAIRQAAETLRAMVKEAVPNAVERVRPGWHLIGYDVPLGRRSVYFAFIAPEPIHCHLGFEHGVAMADPHRLLEGAQLKLRKVRFLTFRPGDPIPELEWVELVREAARVAALPRERRLALALDRDWAPPEGGHG
jgi:hypothetical protein